MVEGFPDPFPSVTNIIKATVPKELAWWGMQVGCAGVAELISRGVRPHENGELWVAQLSAAKLTVNDTLKAAGRRGTEVHDILEAYGKTGNLPDYVSDHAAGYARALGLFLLENNPEFLVQETMTASLKHKYAGTFDGKCVFQSGKFRSRYCMIDLKTSKKVYKDQHHPQIEAYEYSEVELGEDPTELRIIVRLAENGKYQMSVSTDTFDDFYVLLKHYESIQARKARPRFHVRDLL